MNGNSGVMVLEKTCGHFERQQYSVSVDASRVVLVLDSSVRFIPWLPFASFALPLVLSASRRLSFPAFVSTEFRFSRMD